MASATDVKIGDNKSIWKSSAWNSVKTGVIYGVATMVLLNTITTVASSNFKALEGASTGMCMYVIARLLLLGILFL
ncbi:MAG: hypothetical protein K1060chlam1_00271 [Candidatus Anoxychlamydiales bacterium]|nr:hypothetical protein [Candidatus Anoxychlamydiales bacterium]